MANPFNGPPFFPNSMGCQFPGTLNAGQSNGNSNAFQGQKIMNAIMLQGKLMQQIAEQNENLHNKLADIRREIENLQVPGLPSDPQSGIVPSKQNLLDLLTGEDTKFDFSLELSGSVPNPVCKGKYFSIKVFLEPVGEERIPIEERIQLGVSLYTAENPPKLINHNMSGGGMIKGHSTSWLTYDENERKHATSFKIQLNEVTSHFRNGWVFLVVQPQTPCEYLEQSGYKLKPLIVKHLVIKAKETTCKRWREKGKVSNILPEATEDASQGSHESSEESEEN
ncbi:unnamed protein product [Blepharisma stoltei]|uniref:Uncharacterized protein n=1 Tax=Blepharisma stoltei TaxID=1481888 RepID=A0AAU9J0E2_9CILI|nr:unnamed protein product [Blepharisma stoltei]